MKMMKTYTINLVVAILTLCGISAQAQIKRPDNFHAKYELKEVVVMSRHNIRSPLSSGGAAYQRVTPYEWFHWSSPSSQLSLRGGVLETEMGLTPNSSTFSGIRCRQLPIKAISFV